MKYKKNYEVINYYSTNESFLMLYESACLNYVISILSTINKNICIYFVKNVISEVCQYFKHLTFH